MRGKQGEFEGQIEGAKASLHDHVRLQRSKTTNKDRRRYLLDHGEEVLAVAHSLLLARSTMFCYQGALGVTFLDCGRLEARHEATARRVIEDGIAERDEMLEETDRLLGLGERKLGLKAVLDGKRTIQFGWEERAGREAAHIARQVHASIADIRGEAHPKQIAAADCPTRVVFKRSVSDDLLRVLGYRLASEERIIRGSFMQLPPEEIPDAGMPEIATADIYRALDRE